MLNRGNKCIECSSDTYAIQVIDRGKQNIHYDLVYVAGKSKSKFCRGHEIEGKSNAELCINHGHITLRAVRDK